ncbi:MAG: hypothetical protein ABSF95_00335 [Verrucomicrobiota bacterium]|jgi:hypothetical protein
MDYGYDTPRKDVRLVGIPFTWNTNLEDQDIVSLYSLIANDPEIGTPSAPVDVAGPMSISLRLFDKLVEFKEGACHCLRVNDTIYAVYKTTQEWEFWAARQAEIQELKDEQDLERKVERELVWAEECYLISKCTDACNGRDYESAFNWLCARADLLRQHNSNRFGTFMFDEVFMRLSSFPARHCIEFLRRHAAPYTSYLRVATSKAFWGKPPDCEFQELFDAAIADYPAEGMLFKEITLFWDRRKNYHLARKYCEVAASRSLTDDTKSGFTGRLRRLDKKAGQNAAPNGGPAAPQGDSGGPEGPPSVV